MRPVCCRVALLASVLFSSASCTDTPKADSAVDSSTVAESAVGESCAAKLSPEARAVFRAAAPDMRRNTDLPSLLRRKVMFMVFSDRLQRSAARPAAEQAATCLQLLRH